MNLGGSKWIMHMLHVTTSNLFLSPTFKNQINIFSKTGLVLGNPYLLKNNIFDKRLLKALEFESDNWSPFVN